MGQEIEPVWTVLLTAATVLISLGALIVAVKSRSEAANANHLAAEANAIAGAAREDALDTRLESAWDQAVAALVRFQSVNWFTVEDTNPISADLRSNFLNLIDKLGDNDFAEWVGAELRLGNTLSAEVMMKSEGRTPTLQEGDELRAEWVRWAINFQDNLRVVRSRRDAIQELAGLADQAKSANTEVRSRLGWPDPATPDTP